MIELIRDRFRPIQPLLKQLNSEVQYNEYPPSLKLQAFIYCYWELKTKERLSQTYNYRVITDGCIDIFFENSAPEKIYLMGFSTTYSEFPLGNSFHYTGIRFLPTAFSHLFQINASEFSDQVVPLKELKQSIAQSLEEINSDNQSFNEKKEQLNQLFEKILRQAPLNFDPRLYRAIDYILKKRGNVEVESELDIGLSPRQLRRLFEYYLGDSQKSFSRVVRFQSAVSEVLAVNKPALPDFFSLGYFDQTHFIKDFKQGFGLPPGKALRNS